MNPVLHSKPWITDADLGAIRSVLLGGMIAQGQVVAEFEREIGNWVNSEPGVAVGSGSSAIVLSLMGLGVTSGDEVIVPTYVCKSVAEAVCAVGAVPVFCDVGEQWVIEPANAQRVKTTRTKAVIVPHMYGVYADVAAFLPLGISVIEDCAQAVGHRGERRVAGHAAIFSFHPTKCLTTGEGGMAVANDRDLVARMRAIRDGRQNGIVGRLISPMPDTSAALGRSQLARYEQALTRRVEIAGSYVKVVQRVRPDSLPRTALKNTMHFRFPLQLEGGLDACGFGFTKKGITVRRGVDRLLHRLAGLADDGFGTAVRHFGNTISVPIYPALTAEETDRCVDAMKAVFLPVTA